MNMAYKQILSIAILLAAFTKVSRFAIAATTPCVGTINSFEGQCISHHSINLFPHTIVDVATAVKCATVNLNSFTVPAGQGLTLNLQTGATVNMSNCHESS